MIDFFAPVREDFLRGETPPCHGAALEPRSSCDFAARSGRAGVFTRARAMGLEGIVWKRAAWCAHWSGNCRSRTEAKNPSFARLALHEKRARITARRKASAFAPGKTTTRKALLRHGRGRRYHIG